MSPETDSFRPHIEVSQTETPEGSSLGRVLNKHHLIMRHRLCLLFISVPRNPIFQVRMRGTLTGHFPN